MLPTIDPRAGINVYTLLVFTYLFITTNCLTAARTVWCLTAGGHLEVVCTVEITDTRRLSCWALRLNTDARTRYGLNGISIFVYFRRCIGVTFVIRIIDAILASRALNVIRPATCILHAPIVATNITILAIVIIQAMSFAITRGGLTAIGNIQLSGAMTSALFHTWTLFWTSNFICTIATIIDVIADHLRVSTFAIATIKSLSAIDRPTVNFIAAVSAVSILRVIASTHQGDAGAIGTGELSLIAGAVCLIAAIGTVHFNAVATSDQRQASRPVSTGKLVVITDNGATGRFISAIGTIEILITPRHTATIIGTGRFILTTGTTRHTMIGPSTALDNQVLPTLTCL